MRKPQQEFVLKIFAKAAQCGGNDGETAPCRLCFDGMLKDDLDWKQITWNLLELLKHGDKGGKGLDAYCNRIENIRRELNT